MSFATGKRIIVTGANSGIGFETTRLLAAFGAEIIMVCRSKERGEAAQAKILEQDPDADLTLFIADLSSRTSIADLSSRLHGRYSAIHILINNAGSYFPERRTSENGIEYTFALNHLGSFRLTTALMDLLQAGAPARVINVSSDGHRFVSMQDPRELRELQNPQDYRGFRAYCQSKLCNILFTRELARRTADLGITTASLHPGFVRTNFGSLQGTGLGSKLFRLSARLFAKSPQRGAATSVFLADSPEIKSGMYYARCKLSKPSATARSDKLAAALWEYSETLA